MKNTIDLLEKEHKAIQEVLEKLLLSKEGCPEGNVLGRFEQLVLNHIAREDVEIYSPLQRIAQLTPEAMNFLEASRRDLNHIKISALVFFEKYKEGQTEKLCKGFPQDLKRLSENLQKRIVFEDKELFPFLTNLWSKL